MSQPIHLYTSAQPGPARAFAELLADNLPKPVLVHPLSELPPPDRQRPTRQQLRTELAEQQQSLSTCRDLIKLTQPHPRLAPELADLQAEEQRVETRIAEILQQLNQQKGGSADG